MKVSTKTIALSAVLALSAKGKAYGRYCAGKSRKHVAGQHGTPFSRCVSAGARLLAHRS